MDAKVRTVLDCAQGLIMIVISQLQAKADIDKTNIRPMTVHCCTSISYRFPFFCTRMELHSAFKRKGTSVWEAIHPALVEGTDSAVEDGR